MKILLSQVCTSEFVFESTVERPGVGVGGGGLFVLSDAINGATEEGLLKRGKSNIANPMHCSNTPPLSLFISFPFGRLPPVSAVAQEVSM